MGLFTVLDDLFLHLSIPGFAHFTHRTGPRAWFWLVAGVCGLSLTLAQVFDILFAYFTFEVATRVVMEDQVNLKLPAVALCPFSRISCANLAMLIPLVKEKWILDHLCELQQLTGCNRHSNTNSSTSLCSTQFQSVIDMDQDEEFYWETTAKIDQLRMELPAVVQYKLPHDVTTLLAICTHGGSSCTNLTIPKYEYEGVDERTCFPLENSKKIFEGFLNLHDSEESKTGIYYFGVSSSKYGKCMFFNLYNHLEQEKLGPYGGFSFLLRLVEQKGARLGYLEGMSGMAVTLSAPNQLTTDRHAYLIRPNTATTLALETKVRRFLPSPYPNRCISSWDNTVFVRLYNTSLLTQIVRYLEYSRSFCDVLCRIKSTIEQCNCYFSTYDVVNLKNFLRGWDDELKQDCTIRTCASGECLNVTFKSPQEECQCYPECEQIGFSTQLSVSKWPAESYWQDAAKVFSIDGSDDSIRARERWKSDVQESVARVDVYFRSSKTIVVQEVAVYKNLSAVLTALGGALAVHLGMSFFTLVGFLEFLWDRVDRQFQH